MTIRQVMDGGFHTRHETGSAAKVAWLNQESARRFMDLRWVMEARRIDLRTAHRRWLRRNGYKLYGRKAA